VFRRIGQVLVVCALVLSIGGHWTVLQSVAWVGMAVRFAQESPLSLALEKTFDGKHACKLCKAVQAGKATEKKREAHKPVTKLEFAMLSIKLLLFPPQFEAASFASPAPPDGHHDSPPSPPPERA
jgi:hypothetical protein